jgi:hypothetical protein
MITPKPNPSSDASSGAFRTECDGVASPAGEAEHLYLYFPPGEYQLPARTLPIDIDYLARAIPGAEIRRLSESEHRRPIEAQHA